MDRHDKQAEESHCSQLCEDKDPEGRALIPKSVAQIQQIEMWGDWQRSVIRFETQEWELYFVLFFSFHYLATVVFLYSTLKNSTVAFNWLDIWTTTKKKKHKKPGSLADFWMQSRRHTNGAIKRLKCLSAATFHINKKYFQNGFSYMFYCSGGSRYLEDICFKEINKFPTDKKIFAFYILGCCFRTGVGWFLLTSDHFVK